MCDAPDPEFMSTDQAEGYPPVPVCGLQCEADYLQTERSVAPEKKSQPKRLVRVIKGKAKRKSKKAIEREEAEKLNELSRFANVWGPSNREGMYSTTQ